MTSKAIRPPCRPRNTLPAILYLGMRHAHTSCVSSTTVVDTIIVAAKDLKKEQ